MEHLKEILTRYGITASDIRNLETFASRDGFVLLDEDEFREMQEYFSEFPVYQFLVPFMTDDTAAYWCVYADGPLKNMVCYVSHEELDLAPRFRSLSSFIDAIRNQPQRHGMAELEDRFFDFPSRQESPTSWQDQEIIGALYNALAAATDDDQQRTQTAFAIMALTSPSNIETIIYPFLADEDMYVQERAIALLGFHAYKPAVAKLRALVTQAHPNGQTAAKVALKKIAASGQ